MYQNIKVIVCVGMFMISAIGLFAQTDTIISDVSNVLKEQQGQIVMSKSELKSFLEKIAEARKEKLQLDLENANLQNSNSQYSRSSYGVNDIGVASYMPSRAAAPFSSNIPVQNMSRDDLMREIDALNSRLNYMSGYGGGYGGGNGGGGSTTFITSPGNTQSGGYYPYQAPYQTQSPLVNGILPLAPNGNNGELRWKIDSLQRQINMLSTPVISIEKKDEILRLNREKDQIQDSLIVASVLTPEAKEIVKQYGTSQMQVFFENDMSEVSSRYQDEVEKAAVVLKKNMQLGVVLKGFASPVGNPKYNYDLSMRRNEAVKRMLIDYGVFPDQISSVFYGEDKTSTASEARRVDIKFIIK